MFADNRQGVCAAKQRCAEQASRRFDFRRSQLNSTQLNSVMTQLRKRNCENHPYIRLSGGSGSPEDPGVQLQNWRVTELPIYGVPRHNLPSTTADEKLVRF